jgi:hypothetical protein
MTPLPAEAALAAYYLEARSKLLDLAAALDRVERGTGAADLSADPRLERLRAGLRMILEGADTPAGRAAAVQRLFSLEYDPAWVRPDPR